MRIAILVGGFPPKWLAGTEISTYNLAKYLAKRGHEVHVITAHDDDLPDFSEESGFYVHRVAWSKVRIVGILPFWMRMYLQIRRIKPDVVHSQSLLYGIPAMMAKKNLKIPYAVWGRGSEIYLPGRPLAMISKSILRNADAILALTEDMKQAMQNLCDKEIFVVPNGIDLEMFKPPLESRKGSNAKTIIFVGRLHPVKGVQYLIEAMNIVHQKMPEAELILVGDGKEREHLKSLTGRLGLKECIEFAGRVPHEKIQDYMGLADVFVLPGLSEGFPVTILEAMACGLPVVATRVGGLPDIIEDSINGYLVEAMDQEQIAEALLKILQDERLRKEISNNNRETAGRYTWDMVAVTIEGIYQNISRSSK